MKRINQILKSLNFPKFYSKTRDGEFTFNPSEKYTDVDLSTLLENLPYTEDTIHEDDVQFIIQYLQYLNCIDKKVIDSYLLTLLDNTSLVALYDTPFGGGCKTKVEEILSNFTKRGHKILDKIDREDGYCDCKKHKSKSQEKLLEPVIEMMETLAGSMLKAIEKKEEKKDGEYVFNHTDKGIKIEKASLKGPETVVDKDFSKAKKSSYRKELKKLIKQTKYSLKSFNKHGKSEFGESKKKLKKNLKKWKRVLKDLKK